MPNLPQVGHALGPLAFSFAVARAGSNMAASICDDGEPMRASRLLNSGRLAIIAILGCHVAASSGNRRKEKAKRIQVHVQPAAVRHRHNLYADDNNGVVLETMESSGVFRHPGTVVVGKVDGKDYYTVAAMSRYLPWW